jgi:hypothetical protein
MEMVQRNFDEAYRALNRDTSPVNVGMGDWENASRGVAPFMKDTISGTRGAPGVLLPGQGVKMTGEELHRTQSVLGQAARRAENAAIPQFEQSAALQDARGALLNARDKQFPELVGAHKDLAQKYKEFNALNEASEKSVKELGEFTPLQALREIKKSGVAPQREQWYTDMQEVLPDRIANSYTANRMMLARMLGVGAGAGAGAAAYQSGADPAAATALALALALGGRGYASGAGTQAIYDLLPRVLAPQMAGPYNNIYEKVK